MTKPLLSSQYNPHINETNYILNKLIEKEEKFEEKIYPCLFILIIDQSGSMSSSIKNVIKNTIEFNRIISPRFILSTNRFW